MGYKSPTKASPLEGYAWILLTNNPNTYVPTIPIISVIRPEAKVICGLWYCTEISPEIILITLK